MELMRNMDAAEVKKRVPEGLFEGGGEMGALMEAFDRENHPLGPPEKWPQSLQTPVRLILRSAFPMFIWWSEELYMFHNDAYLPALGNKHPEALGASAREMWAEIWADIGGVAEGILRGKGQFYAKDLPLFLERHGFSEETYWTFSYSPMPADDGTVGGIFCACNEVTENVLGQRRLRAIKEIAEAATQQLTVEEACQQACELLAHFSSDLPYSLIYLVRGNQCHLAGKAGHHPPEAAPAILELSDDKAVWPCAIVQQTRQKQLLTAIGPETEAAVSTGLPHAAQAVVLPLEKPGGNQLYGFLVAGLSSSLPYDAAYEGFHDLLARQITSTIFSIDSCNQTAASEKRLRQMANSIPHLVISCGADGHADYANLRWYEFTGLTEAQTLGSGWTTAIHPGDRQTVATAWQRSLGSGDNLVAELRLRNAEGDYRWHRMQAIAGRDESRAVLRWYGTLTDIHDQKMGEAELQQRRNLEQLAMAEAERQQQRLHHLLMQAPACFALTKGPRHIFELANPLFQQMFGNRPLLGIAIREALPELEGQQFFGLLDQVYSTGETQTGRGIPATLDRKADGTLDLGYFDFVYQATRAMDGNINGVLIFAYEVTTQVEALHKVEASEELLQLALTSGNMATFDLDMQANATVRSINHDQLFGYDKPLEVWNLDVFLKHMLPEDRPGLLRQLEKSLQTGVLFVNPRIKRADGELRWVEALGKVTLNEAGEPIRITGVIMDVTSRRQAELELSALTEQLALAYADIQARHNELAQTNEQLKRINSDLDNFVYTASHDLRSPINAMEGLLLVLEEQLAGRIDEEERQVMDFLASSMAKLNQTIRELSEIVKAQKDTDLPHEPVSFAAVLADVQADIPLAIEDRAGRDQVGGWKCPP